MKGRCLLLGTGGSLGVPVIGCSCSVCLSPSPYNKRSRSGCLIEINGKRLLIDASQDIREQALQNGITTIDGVLFTHVHHDHTAGIDDLRVYKKNLPCLLSKATYEDLKTRYGYIFGDSRATHTLIASFAVEILPSDRGRITFCGTTFNYFTFSQVGMLVNGFRFGDLAYLSDIKDYADALFDDLVGVNTLILSALRHETSKMHFSVAEAVAFSKRVGAKRTILTHIAHELDHAATNELLPPNIRMGYDGMELSFEGEEKA